MQDAIDRAKADFTQAKERLVHGLTTTPDDRINWSPSPSSRSVVHQVAHAARSVKDIKDQLAGTPFPIPTTEEADSSFREWERQFSTREQVLELFERNGKEYLDWLDALTPEGFESTMVLPFKLGEAPISIALTFVPMHLNWHAAQIDSIQTIYGDLDWHLQGN